MTDFNNNDIDALDELTEPALPDIKTLKFHKVHTSYLSIVLISLIIPLPIFIIINACLILFVEPFVWGFSLIFWAFYLFISIWNMAYAKSLKYALVSSSIF